MKHKFFGIVKNGQLIFDDLSYFSERLKEFNDKRIEIIVQKEQQDITNQQLAYYYACIIKPLARHLGYFDDEMDFVLKRKCLGKQGKKAWYIKNKTELSREGLAEFIDKCIIIAAEEGVVVDPPNPSWRVK